MLSRLTCFAHGKRARPVAAALITVALTNASSMAGRVAMAQTTLAPAEHPTAQEADPFTQFDIGVIGVAAGAEQGSWRPLAQSEIHLTPVLIHLEAGQTIDALLEARHVRHDEYSRSLLELINPDIADLDAVRVGQDLTFFNITGTIAGADEIALKPFQQERQRAQIALDVSRAQVGIIQQRYGEERALLLRRSLASASSAYRGYFSNSLAGNRFAADSLESIQSRISSYTEDSPPNLQNWNDDASFIRGRADAVRHAPQILGAGGSDGGMASLKVYVTFNSAPAVMLPGVCKLMWAVNGNQHIHDIPQDLPPLPATVTARPSFLRVWVERAGVQVSAPSDGVVDQSLLYGPDPHITVNLTSSCQ